jgi:hypothetical protein
LPDPKRYGVAGCLKLLGTHCLIERFGLQTARSILNSDGNAARHMQPYLDFVRDCSSYRFTAADIFEVYRESTRRQIAA